MAWMLSFVIRDRGSLQIQGPKSLEFLHRAAPGQVPERFGYFNAGLFRFDGMEEVLISRTGFTGEMGIEIYGNPENDPSAFWDYIFEGARNSIWKWERADR